MNKRSVLVLERFCGRETYPVIDGTWNIFNDEELGAPTLCIQLRAGKGIELHEDTKELRAEPSWEINVVSKILSTACLAPGAKFSVPKGYDTAQGGYVTNFYYCSHEATDDNLVEILAVDGSTLLVRLSGQTIDVNFYDGSKLPTRLFVEVHLSHDTKVRRSMS
ncbi:MAG TPA: hypothetical protein VIT67_09750 [Povalibacter sp.]